MAEDVEGARGGEFSGDFDARDEAEAELGGFGGGFRQAVAGVVVGEGDGGELRGGGGLHELGGGEGAVGGGGMGVKIDVGH